MKEAIEGQGRALLNLNHVLCVIAIFFLCFFLQASILVSEFWIFMISHHKIALLSCLDLHLKKISMQDLLCHTFMYFVSAVMLECMRYALGQLIG